MKTYKETQKILERLGLIFSACCGKMTVPEVVDVMVAAFGTDDCKEVLAAYIKEHCGDGRYSEYVLQQVQMIPTFEKDKYLWLDLDMHPCHVNQTAHELFRNH